MLTLARDVGGLDESTGNVLLSDPQMMTHPFVPLLKTLDIRYCSNGFIFYRSLGQLFADGNIDQTFISFPDEHCCDDNVFCLYFKPGAIVLPETATNM